MNVENKKDSFRSNVDGGPEEANNKETLNNEKLKLKFKHKCDQIWRNLVKKRFNILLNTKPSLKHCQRLLIFAMFQGWFGIGQNFEPYLQIALPKGKFSLLYMVKYEQTM